jgi:hypothetical protein
MAKEISFSLCPLLEKEKLKADISNFIDWLCILTIVLRCDRKEYILNTPILAEPRAVTIIENITMYTNHNEYELDVQSLLVGIMGYELQKRFIKIKTYDICEQLKNMFPEQARVEKYKVIKSLLCHKMAERSSISTYVLHMTSDVE